MPLPAPQAIEALDRHLRDGEPLPSDARDVILAGLKDYLAGNEKRLDRALGLVTWGGVSPARQRALAERDRLLRQLWKASPEWRDMTPYAAACLMAISAARYETNRFPRERDAHSAPSAEPAATWWRIFRSGLSVPGSKQLQKILEAEFQDGFEIPTE